MLGLIPDKEILRCKGPPVMSEEERKTMVESVKWVGEVITGTVSCRSTTCKLYVRIRDELGIAFSKNCVVT